MPAAGSVNLRCIDCGYVEQGDTPPDTCPVCGAGRDRFEQVVAPGEETGADGKPVRLLILGGGVAGMSAAHTARKHSSRAEIAMVNGEAEKPYYRLNLTRYLAGEIERDTLPMQPDSWYAGNRVELVNDSMAEQILRREKIVLLRDGRRLPYDQLILAVGAHPFVPPIAGTGKEGALTLRTTSDADRLLENVQKGLPCVCIGGGVLGIEAAGAMARRGADVTMIEGHDRLMPRQLNANAGQVLEDHMRRIGVKVVKNARPVSIEGESAVTGVKLNDGTLLPAGVALISTGIRANTYLPRKAGLDIADGVAVDDHLRTSDPSILAAGDVAEHRGTLYGSWAASQYQGSIAALNAVGVPTMFGGIPRSTTVKALGLEITSAGVILPEDASHLAIEKRTGDLSYVCFIFHDGRLEGAILIGHADLAPQVKKAIESGSDFSLLARQEEFAGLARTLADLSPPGNILEKT